MFYSSGVRSKFRCNAIDNAYDMPLLLRVYHAIVTTNQQMTRMLMSPSNCLLVNCELIITTLLLFFAGDGYVLHMRVVDRKIKFY